MDKLVVKLTERESLERDEFEEIIGVTKEEVKKANKYKVSYGA